MATADICLEQIERVDASTGARVVFALTATVSISLFIFYAYKYSRKECTLYALYVQSITAGVYSISAAGYSDFIYADLAINGELRSVPLGRYMFWVVSCPCVLFSFLALYSMVGPPVEPSKINFMVMKDLVTLATGIVSTYQNDVYIKGFFVILAFSMGFWFLIDLYGLEQRRQKYLEGVTVFWVRLTTYAFLVTWGIFPMLFLTGANVLNMTSPDVDYIGHAIGDLLAKNCFGFLCWWVRYRVLVPYRKEKGLAHTDVHNPGYTASHEIQPRNQGLVRQTNSNGSSSKLVTPAQLLVVEPDASFQRLIMYLLEGTDVEFDIVFSFDQAQRVIRRGATDQFDVVLVNMSSHWSAPEELLAFRAECGGEPYHFPVVGYTFAEDEDSLMRKEETGKHLTDGLIKYMLDPARLTQGIDFWRAMHEEWLERSQPRGGAHLGKHSRHVPQIHDQYDYVAPSRHAVQPYSSFTSSSSSSSSSSFTDKRPADLPHVSIPTPTAASRMPAVAASPPVGSPRSQGSLVASPANRSRRSISFDQNHGISVDSTGVVSNRISSRSSFSGELPPSSARARSPSARSPSSMNSPPTFEAGGEGAGAGGGAGGGPVRCDNDGCNMNAKLTCSGCHQKSYCTSYCQVKHWKHGHKKDCNGVVDNSAQVVFSDPPHF